MTVGTTPPRKREREIAGEEGAEVKRRDSSDLLGIKTIAKRILLESEEGRERGASNYARLA